MLGLEPIGDEARRAHEGIIRNVLQNGTKISLLVRAHRPAVREYRIERTIPNPPLVRDDHGEVSNLSPQDVLPSVEVFGQHEISELTKSPEKLTRLLARFVDRDDDLPRKKADLRRTLEKSRKSLLNTRAELAQIEERLAALPGLEETLERFREAGLEDRLKEQSLLVREERLLASIPERLASFRECLETLKREVPMDHVFLSAKALEDLPGKDDLSALERRLQNARPRTPENREGPGAGARSLRPRTIWGPRGGKLFSTGATRRPRGGKGRRLLQRSGPSGGMLSS